MQILEDYRASSRSRKRLSSVANMVEEVDSSVGLVVPVPLTENKKKNYSNQESAMIMKVVDEYLEVHCLTVRDICPALRESEEGYMVKQKRKSCSLWNELHELVPGRSVVSLYGHVQSKLFSATKTADGSAKKKWDQSEIAQLVSLVGSHGQQWSYIGRLMERFPGREYSAANSVFSDDVIRYGHISSISFTKY